VPHTHAAAYRWGERISRHSELKEKSRDATRVLIVIVCIFLICNFWGFVLALLERIVGQDVLYKDYTKFYQFSRETINFLAIINSSINFIIYCIFGKDFRKELVIVYGCGFKGITIRLPVHDKFSAWRHYTRRRTNGGELKQTARAHAYTQALQRVQVLQRLPPAIPRQLPRHRM
jgi:hypothetical protein